MSEQENNQTAPAAQEAPKAAVKTAPATLRFVLGEKLGMTQLFDDKGNLNAVSVVKDNGTSARLSVTVTCLEAPSASLALALNGTTVTNWENVVEGETYSLTVPTVQGRAYDFAFTGTPAGYSTVMSAGAFSSLRFPFIASCCIINLQP